MKPARSPFLLPSPNFLSPTAGLCLLHRDGDRERAPLFPRWQWGGHCHTNHPFIWKHCKILHRRSRWKIRWQKLFLWARAVQRAGWRWDGTIPCAAPGPAVHRDLSPSPGTCVSWPGVNSMQGRVRAQVYPKRSLTHLPQPNTRALLLSQPLQPARCGRPRNTKRKVNPHQHE